MSNEVRNASRGIEADPDHGPEHSAIWMVFVMLLFTVVALAWACFAKLDVAVQARGAVEASSRVAEVQSLEGGIVRKLLVRAGQAVRQGELLVQLDTAQYEADLGENRQQHLAALAGRARTDALLRGTEPQFDPIWIKEAPDLIQKETELWREGLHELEALVRTGKEAIRQHEGELEETRSRMRSLQAEARVAKEALAIEERLHKQGAGARVDYLAAKQRALAQQSEYDKAQQSLPRLTAAVEQAKGAAEQEIARVRTQWSGQRSEFETRVATQAQALGGRADRLARRDLTSPVDGVVNRLLVQNVGGVAQPGKAILEVVPNDARLLMTARITPSEIGFLRPGQDARVRVLPYDSSTYGQMGARLERIGADAVVDEKGNAYFEVQLSAERDQLKSHGKPLRITPGMPVEASILTGERSVMQYMLKPVLRAVQGALQER